jgi:hypothetical protein
VNFFGPKRFVESQDQISWESTPPPESFSLRRKRAARAAVAERNKDRLERDIARGYSINVKQVILAFAVEFVIIGLILTSWFLSAVQIPNWSGFTVLQGLLFPISLAMVELARVPLAIAVRIQKSWNIKFAALLGVSCAVVVTSASLYLIGNSSFNQRLETVHAQRELLDLSREHKEAFSSQQKTAQKLVERHTEEFNTLSDHYKLLASQLNTQPNQCTFVSTPKPDGSTDKRWACPPNPGLKKLLSEIEATKIKQNEEEALIKQSQAELAKLDPSQIDNELSISAKAYRDAIFRSPLHSYAAMLFKKDPKDVSEGEVKTLEWYLILIPSIAAALSSTFIAMTAVHRVRPPNSQVVTAIPDEAASYLFGPLMTEIKREAKVAVERAVLNEASQKKEAASSA